MTKIHMESDGDRYILSAQGHATGSVEVCAAISGILYALAGYLSVNEAAQEHRRVMEDAKVYLEYSGGADVEAAYDMALVGLLQIRESYPELVQIEILEN